MTCPAIAARSPAPRRDRAQPWPAPWRRTWPWRSNGTDLGRLRALLAGLDREFDALALGQFAVALHVDVGLVDEHVTRAVFRRDEPESLGRVEPLDGTYSHWCCSPSQETCNRRSHQPGRHVT